MGGSDKLTARRHAHRGHLKHSALAAAGHAAACETAMKRRARKLILGQHFTMFDFLFACTFFEIAFLIRFQLPFLITEHSHIFRENFHMICEIFIAAGATAQKRDDAPASLGCPPPWGCMMVHSVTTTTHAPPACGRVLRGIVSRTISVTSTTPAATGLFKCVSPTFKFQPDVSSVPASGPMSRFSVAARRGGRGGGGARGVGGVTLTCQ